jgi:splicing factor 3A subunit 1
VRLCAQSCVRMVGTATASGLTFNPPQDRRNIIDKTAQFVARLGKEFETRIFNNEQNNPKFSFLKPGDLFYPYYKNKVREMMIEQGIAVPVETHNVDGTSEVKKEEPKKKVQLTPAQQLLSSVKRPKADPQPAERMDFTLDIPVGLNALDVDIIKLTAQFVAQNGTQFLFGLVKREHRNPQFDFLNHLHPLHPYFNALVEQYTKCLLPSSSGRIVADQLRNRFKSKVDVLHKLTAVMEWERKEAKARKEAEDEAEKERTAMALIDWHDFVIVETIDFFDDEELPAPFSHSQLLELSKKPPVFAEKLEEAMETDEMEMEDVAPMSAPSPPPPPVVPVVPPPPTAKVEDMDDESIKIVKDYDYSRVRQQARNTGYQICPKCGQQVPVEEMAEHMRIELLDPRARAVRQQLAERNKVSTLAADDEISRNLGNFAERRTDIFGDKEVEIGKTLGEEDIKGPEKIIWDGHAGSIAMTTNAALGLTLQEQAARMSGIKAQKPEDHRIASVIGPAEHPLKPGLPSDPQLPLGLPSTGISINPAPAVPLMPKPTMPPVMMMANPSPFLRAPGAPLLGNPMMPNMMPMMMMSNPMMSMMHPEGIPLPPRPAPYDDDDEPYGKRSKAENLNVIPEDDWLAQNPGPTTIKIQLPVSEEKQEWNLNGQQIELTLDTKETISGLKEKLSAQLGGMPANKQKLKLADSPFFKDTQTLAYYNLGTGTTIYLSVKSRGRGRKK